MPEKLVRPNYVCLGEAVTILKDGKRQSMLVRCYQNPAVRPVRNEIERKVYKQPLGRAGLGVLGLAQLPLQLRSFKTTNCLENINRQLENTSGRVCRWQNSNQRQRWIASALLQIEPRLNKINGYKHLGLLREKMKQQHSQLKQVA